jgi:hypothetical protein
MGRRQTIPSNQDGVAVVPVFGPDQYGTHLFAGTLEANGVGLNTGIRPVIDARGTGRWHGWTNGLQNFRGAGNLGAGRPVVPTTTRLDQTSGSAVSTPVQQIFEERMAAGRLS